MFPVPWLPEPHKFKRKQTIGLEKHFTRRRRIFPSSRLAAPSLLLFAFSLRARKSVALVPPGYVSREPCLRKLVHENDAVHCFEHLSKVNKQYTYIFPLVHKLVSLFKVSKQYLGLYDFL